MQGFLEEYSNILKLPLNELSKDFKVILVGGKIIEILNYIKILTYNENYICLKILNNELNIDGSCLIIKELSKKDMIISGNINKIYLSKEILNEKK